MIRIGLISDTHGLLRPEALDALRGSDHIVHAGDIGDAGILAALAALAPVTAIRGNNDNAAWATGLTDAVAIELGGRAIYVLHDLKTLARHPPPTPPDVIISGHSHKPSIELRDGVLFVNPGSAGRRRFRLPITVAELRIGEGRVEAVVLPLPIAS